MKNLFNKKISAFILSVLLLAAFLIPAAAFADTEAESGQQEAHPPRLVDDADLLSPEEETALLSELDRISSEQGVDLVIVTVNSTDGKTPEAYADDYFDYNGYGLGKDRSGALLLRSFEPKYVHISTRGKAIKYFTDSNIESILDAIEYDIKAEDYAAAFRTFASYAEDDIISGKKNSHLNLYHIIIALVIGFFVSGIPMNAMKKALTTVGKKTEAQDYVVNDSLQIANASDLFLYRNVIRTEIPRENKGGGSSTHTSSSGSTHGGGGRSM